ncbi:putative transmembrane protein [Gregarina niphandrodes]|uniref:Transmembrane protein n=1 Tax=Gregarina niphandrodes TaxID=110365 RepID=A0A023B6K9_GRENI|nr:putative transmembrane protein [Gregarina niphandrodes]EZG66591.1 putative transmembrane protein [Gregarina niphandrodes]|eukprot:XP_011130577.1 putative transmembrane protein [Gregarina niphandrodes]
MAIQTMSEWIVLQSASCTWVSQPISLTYAEVPACVQVKFVNYKNSDDYFMIQVNIVSSDLRGPRPATAPGRWFLLSVPSSPQFVLKNDSPWAIIVGWPPEKKRVRPMEEERRVFDSALDWLREGEKSSELTQLEPGASRVVSVLPWCADSRHVVVYKLAGLKKERWATASLLDASASSDRRVWEMGDKYACVTHCQTSVNKEGVRIFRVWTKAVTDLSTESEPVTPPGRKQCVQTAFVRARVMISAEALGVSWRINGRPLVQALMQELQVAYVVAPKECVLGEFEPRAPMAYLEEAAERRKKHKPHFIDLDLLPGALRPVNHGRDYLGAVQVAQLQTARISDALVNAGFFTCLATLDSVALDHFVVAGRPGLLKSSSTIASRAMADLGAEMRRITTWAADTQELRDYKNLLCDFGQRRPGESEGALAKKAFVAYVRKQLLAPTHASVYEKIAVVVAPLLANIELEVLEALAKMLESERGIVTAPFVSSARGGAEVASSVRTRFLPPKQARAVLAPSPVQTLKETKRLSAVFFRLCRASVHALASEGWQSGSCITSVAPKLSDLANMNSVYFENVRLSPISIQVSLRTSGQKIDRSILWIADSLPLDSPYMAVSIQAWERKFIVTTWHELYLRARRDYLQSLFKRSLPSVWLYYVGAPVVGILRGVVQLVKIVREEHRIRHWRLAISGPTSGARLGLVVTMLGFFGGAFHFISHIADIGHKLFKGRRPRPNSILDGFNKGLRGFMLDLLWNPWYSLVVHTKQQLKTESKRWKLLLWVVGRCVRCALSPLMAALHIVASISEGFATTLIGDFDQFKVEELNQRDP